MRVLVLHGPNLNLPGSRLEALQGGIQAQARSLGFELSVFQSNSEGALLDELHRQREWFDAVVVNPTSLAPVAYALAEGLELIGKRAIEVQLVEGRTSVLREVVEAQFHGPQAYSQALEALAGHHEEKSVPSRQGKSIGRKASQVSPGSPRKTIGRAAHDGAAAPPKTEGLSREVVKAQVSARLSGTLAPEALASWARGQWQALIGGATVEPGQKDVLEEALLTLAASGKATDHVLLSAIAKLDR